jgi:hypothetical protein
MEFVIKSFKYFLTGLCLALVFSMKVFGAETPVTVQGPGPVQVEGAVTRDTTWKGIVLVAGDVLVPEGVTLTIAAGTNVMFAASESSKIEPAFLSMQTEIMVHGRLVAEGEKGKEITFGPAPQEINGKKPERGDWGGVIFDGPESGKSKITNASFTKADTALAFYGSSPDIAGCTVTDCRYGIVSMGGSTPKFEACSITGNEFGVVSGAGGSPTFEKSNISRNEHDFLNRD